MAQKVKVLFTEFVTHDVKHFIVEKPIGFTFIPGQATDVSIPRPGFEDQKRPFTFTSSPQDLILEFTIKCYVDHNGVTKELHNLKPGDEIVLEDPFGTINYKGPGVFLAGGAGITPFISILRNLKKQNTLSGNTLIFSNKEAKDIILEPEFKEMFTLPDTKLVLILSREQRQGYEYGHIDKTNLPKYVADFSKNFYLCGPPKFVQVMKQTLSELGAKADSVVFEE
ncbi:flavodoxin reductase [Candidatus Woesebacteria bacterium]|nr:flavodoxin reductase [Candidatus Woesebacteria bacterium]QQG47712.1 MAG: flavodoxin reductase [Candidatus Woesebacteria bacterium]